MARQSSVFMFSTHNWSHSSSDIPKYNRYYNTRGVPLWLDSLVSPCLKHTTGLTAHQIFCSIIGITIQEYKGGVSMARQSSVFMLSTHNWSHSLLDFCSIIGITIQEGCLCG